MITGPEEGAAAGRGRMRASRADREHVIDVLKTAFADGRLDRDELDARVGQTLAARTYAELATVTADIPAAPLPTPTPRRPARRPVNKEAVKWGLIATGAVIPPAMFVTALYGVPGLALLALPLLFIELIVAIVAAAALARQHAERSRGSGGRLPPRPGQADRAVAAERYRSTGPDPAPPGTSIGQTRADLRVHRSRRDQVYAADPCSRRTARRRRQHGDPLRRRLGPLPAA